MLSKALKLIEQGFSIVLVSAKLKRNISNPCRDRNETIALFTEMPWARIGIAIGKEYRTALLDCDNEQAITVALGWLADRNITPVLQYDTPRGKHFIIPWNDEIKPERIGKMQVRTQGHAVFY